MPSLGGYYDHTMQRIGTQIMEMLSTDTVVPVAFHAGGSKLPAQSTATLQRSRFTKSARHLTGLESRLQNQAATTETPPLHPAEGPDDRCLSRR